MKTDADAPERRCAESSIASYYLAWIAVAHAIFVSGSALVEHGLYWGLVIVFVIALPILAALRHSYIRSLRSIVGVAQLNRVEGGSIIRAGMLERFNRLFVEVPELSDELTSFRKSIDILTMTSFCVAGFMVPLFGYMVSAVFIVIAGVGAVLVRRRKLLRPDGI